MTIVDTGLDKLEKLAQNLSDPRSSGLQGARFSWSVMHWMCWRQLELLVISNLKIAQAMLNVMYVVEIPNDVQDAFNLWTRGTVRAPKHRRRRTWISEMGGH